MAIVTKEFTASGSWTAPAGVTSVIIRGFGGGGGGAYKNSTTDPSGGAGAGMGHMAVTTVPNTSYTVTIGAGGTGATVLDTDGGQGGSTSLGALHVFQGATGSTYLTGGADYTLGITGGGAGDMGNGGSMSNTGYLDGSGGTGDGGGGGGRGVGATASTNAAANTGGGGGSSDSGGGGGGNGGSGWLQIIWFEG